jgi:GNAT superfamily N-acetyltransferase
VRVKLRVRQLEEGDLDEADRILRLAFDTFLGLKPPTSNFGDRDLIRTRWRADPNATFAVELDGRLIGSNFATNWGSVAFFGPLSVHPEFWNKGIGSQLLEPTMELFGKWRSRHVGLFTFANSPRHAALYQKFGFWPRFITAIMSKAPAKSPTSRYLPYSETSTQEQRALISQCARLTDRIYPGLDLHREIEAVDRQRLGETLILRDGSEITGFAICQIGAGTEAGSGNLYVKFGVSRARGQDANDFEKLLDACQSLAADRGLQKITAGVNAGRIESYQRLLAAGFQTNMQGIAMHRGNDEGYNRPGVYLIDDWR